jgi:hypothetical protein
LLGFDSGFESSGKVIQNSYVVTGIVEQPNCVRTDVSGSAYYKNIHDGVGVVLALKFENGKRLVVGCWLLVEIQIGLRVKLLGCRPVDWLVGVNLWRSTRGDIK